MTTMQRVAATFVAIAVAGGVALRADADRLQDASAVLTEMSNADNGIPPNLWAKAKCVAVIPGVKKAALGIGGQYGRGYISCRNDSAAGWSAPGAVRIEGGSIGFQIGGSDTDVIMLVLNDRGVDRLLSSKFTVGADAAVAAGPVGRQASAQTDATMMAEILAWSRSRGAYAGISLQGSTLREDDSENKELYGSDMHNKDIVKGDTKVPASAEVLVNTLSKFKPE
jgi:lipid-binding SYLF domain-containing protein